MSFESEMEKELDRKKLFNSRLEKSNCTCTPKAVLCLKCQARHIEEYKKGLESVSQYNEVHNILMQLNEYDLAFDVLKAKHKRMELQFTLDGKENGYDSNTEADSGDNKGL